MGRLASYRFSFSTLTVRIVAITWIPVAWIVAKAQLEISDRYLPHPIDVIKAVYDLGIPLSEHFAVSFCRIFVGYVLGCALGIYAGALIYRYSALRQLSMPALQSLRAVPATATIPFFLLWFGFSETGKLVIIVMGISFNLAIAVMQILDNMKEKYLVAFEGYRIKKSQLSIKLLVLFAMEGLLPTLRFSLTVAIGLSVVAEYLGAQVGLGYLIQGARTTYSFDSIVAFAILFGMITVIMDSMTRRMWNVIVPWRGKF